MRHIALAILAAASLSSFGAAAAPTSAGVPMIGDEPSPRVIAVRYCGAGWHFRPGHHLPDGRWVHGHCVPDHR